MSHFQIWVCDNFREDFREYFHEDSKVYLIESLVREGGDINKSQYRTLDRSTTEIHYDLDGNEMKRGGRDGRRSEWGSDRIHPRVRARKSRMAILN